MMDQKITTIKRRAVGSVMGHLFCESIGYINLPSDAHIEPVTYINFKGTIVARKGKRDNFDDMWMPEPMSGCWLWLRAISNTYGEYRGKKAHRISYEREKGPIPHGMELDHLCRNRLCVNPDHLEAVPHVVNVRRGHAGFHLRAKQLAKTHCPSGHPYSGDNLYFNRKTNGRHCRKCKAAFERNKRAGVR